MVKRRLVTLGAGFFVAVSVVALFVAPRRSITREGLPERLSDSEFWNLITEFSERGGTFRSENLVSNESAFQRVIPRLKHQVNPGGVYLGVGPDQNFTYIAALEPKLAFILDIRRENMLLHLMYKALFELSNDRSAFLTHLFARRLPANFPTAPTPGQLFELLDGMPSDPQLARHTLSAILHCLRDEHRFDLTSADAGVIERTYRAFVTAGPEIRYSFPNVSRRRFPSYAELMQETDGAPERGKNHSYLASEAHFQAIREMEAENRIIPVVGDFAGEKGLRAIARYARQHNATVSTFYTSNVEFYLFQTEDWRRFFDTVSDLPVDRDSVFIRSYFNNYGLHFPNPPGWLDSPPLSYTLVDSISSSREAYAGGHINSYFDVIRRSKP